MKKTKRVMVLAAVVLSFLFSGCDLFVNNHDTHTWDDGVITTEATCTAEGVMTYTCTVCKATKTESIEKKDHTWNDGEITTAATEEAEGVKTYTCAVCGTTKTEAVEKLAHTHKYSADWSSDTENHWHAATCEHTDEISDKAAHTWDDGEITTAATYTAEGVMTYTCTVCKATKTESIEKLPSNKLSVKVSVAANAEISVKKSETDSAIILTADDGYVFYEWTSLGKIIGEEKELTLLKEDYSAGTYVFDLQAYKDGEYYSANVTVTFTAASE